MCALLCKKTPKQNKNLFLTSTTNIRKEAKEREVGAAAKWARNVGIQMQTRVKTRQNQNRTRFSGDTSLKSFQQTLETHLH